MKTKIVVGFNFSEQEMEHRRSLLHEIGLDDIARSVPGRFGEHVTLSSEDELHRLLESAARRGFGSERFFVRRNREYSAADLLSAQYICVSSLGDQPCIGGPTPGMEYGFIDTCVQCGTGAKQLSALRLTRENLPRSTLITVTQNGEWLVAGSIATVPRTELTVRVAPPVLRF